MINREDMLALTRRMTVKRTSITRIAGGYMDIDGFIDGTFNTSFLKLNPVEQEKNLALAKKVPFAKTNKNLKEYKFSDDQRNLDSMWKLLMGMRACASSGLFDLAQCSSILPNISLRKEFQSSLFIAILSLLLIIFESISLLLAKQIHLKDSILISLRPRFSFPCCGITSYHGIA